VNGQIAIRGTVDDYDRWAQAGCADWSFADVLPYFCRLEADERFGDRPYHGADGPIPIHRAPFAQFGAVDLALAEAALDAGFAWAADHNAPGAFGVSPYAINSRDGARVSTNDAYLEPMRGANNLAIRGGCTVDRVLFDGRRATGLELIAAGRREQVAGRRIVLAAGAIHSPAILLRSGFGPADELATLGVGPRLDLPVGRGLQDHPLFVVTLSLRDACVPPAGFRHTNCCVRTDSGVVDGGRGDLMYVAMNRLGDSLGRRSRADDPPAIGMLGVWLNRCFSRGALRLASVDPLVHPIVELGMLDDASDRARLRIGVRRLVELAAHRSVGTVAATAAVTASGWTGSRDGALSLADVARLDDAALDLLMLATVGDAQHGTSTCRMGAAGDPATVVDPHCRVLGAERLYVVDASIMPEVPCANTHLTAVMIGERMAAHLAD
jgi:choline dehydrogenase